ncbi:MAG TPA: DUF1330 domain-containing protein [Acidobacteriaceae bacterium]|nr:DUF1330 domain-containing protein [Acidobacteriaceae bacterium]
MPVYVISEVWVRDPELFGKYREMARPTLGKYGGRYLVRGGAVETVEGEWVPGQLIIVEFPSMEKAREWYNSPEYVEARKVREHALDRNMIFVEGVPPGMNS